MRFVPTLVALLLFLTLFAGLSVGFLDANAAQLVPTPTAGYVAYRIALTPQTTITESFVLNETAQPTAENEMVQVTFLLFGNGRHVEYSRVLNASSVPEIFPYLLGLNNQSFSYSTRGFDISAHIVHQGQANISFNGKDYQGENYAVSITATNSSDLTTNYFANGNIVTLPSSLIYSVNFHSSGPASLSIQLVATNLPLTSIQQSGTNTLFGFALVGLGLLGAAAVAVPSLFAIVRVRMAKPKPATPIIPQNLTPPAKDKPEYWVD